MTLAIRTAIMPDQPRGPGVAQRCRNGTQPARAGRADEQTWAPVHVAWLQLAGNTINAHTNEDGQCHCCAAPWPCELARQAEFLLGAL